MKTFQCLANLHKTDKKRTRCFTAGNYYTSTGVPFWENGEIVEEFIDDQKEKHLVAKPWLDNYFEESTTS